MNKTVITLIAAGVLSLALPSAFAQNVAPEASPDHSARAEKMREGFAKRFTEADANADGQLSREEANAKMPRLAKHFDAIDTGKTGFITKEQIEARMKKRAGEHHRGKTQPAS